MGGDPSEMTSEGWARWQGHVVNGLFPLGRFLGCSDHSGVFLTESAARTPPLVALKLVPTNRALAESQLPRWKWAGGLAHPHLLRLWEWGGCQLDGLPHLYLVMEYADQTLAQLLAHRALTEAETREMLLPVLDGLMFLHDRHLLQGQLKPTNILVVGDQLKLASDTVRRFGEGAVSSAPAAYHPPEAVHAGNSAAGDVWSLGVTLCEALTRRVPSGQSESGQAIVPPVDLPPAFRDVVTRCLRVSPQDRPTLADLQAWASGQPAGSAAGVVDPPAAPVPAELKQAQPAPALVRTASPPLVAAASTSPAPSTARAPTPRAAPAVIIGAVLMLALGWIAVRAFRTDRAAPQVSAAAQVSDSSLPRNQDATLTTPVRKSVSTARSPLLVRSDVDASSAAPHEVIPDVPSSARRTIRGHIKIWIRVTIGQDGSVSSAVADRTGPSRYFQRLAIEAARKWTFPPVDTPSPRLMQVRFDFSRDGTTGRAVSLH